MPDRDVEIRGLEETRQKVDQVITDLRGERFLNGMREVTAMVSADVKRLTPVDSGRLRNSVTPEVRMEGQTVRGVVGSNVIYAAPVELGARGHWAPSAPLKLWARRKGATLFLASMGDKPYVYLKARKGVFMFQRGLEKNQQAIVQKLGDVVSEIVNK